MTRFLAVLSAGAAAIAIMSAAARRRRHGQEHRPRPRRLGGRRGWRPVYDILQGGRIQRQHRPESADFASPTTSPPSIGCSTAGRPGDPRRPFLRRRGDHRGRRRPKVVGLVYVEAFVPDVGESTFGLLPQGRGAAADRAPRPTVSPSSTWTRMSSRSPTASIPRPRSSWRLPRSRSRSRRRAARRSPSRRGRPSRAGTRSPTPTTSSRPTPSG